MSSRCENKTLKATKPPKVKGINQLWDKLNDLNKCMKQTVWNTFSFSSNCGCAAKRRWPKLHEPSEERTDVVEAARGQPLREVSGKQETGEEGEEEVVAVIGEGDALTAASPKPQKDLKTETTGSESDSKTTLDLVEGENLLA